jgi:N4-gp56 family major capsid protein
MSQTTTSIITHVRSFYDRDLLEKAKPHLIHTWYAQVRDIPQNNSKTIIFRRYSLLSAATTALTEGTTPAGSSLAKTDVTTTLAWYGDFIETTDQLEVETEDPLVLEMNDILGQQAGNTADQLTRDVLVAGTSVQYASTATSRVTVSSAMKLTAAEVREAVRTLKNANAMKITNMVNPSTGVDTVPINSGFVAFVHPNTTYDLQSDANFVPVENYASQANVMPGEVGKLGEVRFVETTNAKVFTAAGAAGIDVYATMILGANAYAVSRIAGYALKTITKPLGSAGAADPLDQRSTHGWKMAFATTRLNENWMVRIEHAVSS